MNDLYVCLLKQEPRKTEIKYKRNFVGETWTQFNQTFFLT